MKHAHFAVSTPIVQTSNYSFENTSDVHEFMKAKQEGRTIREVDHHRRNARHALQHQAVVACVGEPPGHWTQ